MLAIGGKASVGFDLTIGSLCLFCISYLSSCKCIDFKRIDPDVGETRAQIVVHKLIAFIKL